MAKTKDDRKLTFYKKIRKKSPGITNEVLLKKWNEIKDNLPPIKNKE